MAKKKDYGGAWDVDPEMYWSMEDLRELSSSVAEAMCGIDGLESFCVTGIYCDTDNNLTIEGEYSCGTVSVTEKIDLRKAKTCKELVDKYTSVFVDSLLAGTESNRIDMAEYYSGLGE